MSPVRAALVFLLLLAPLAAAGNSDYAGVFADHTGYNTQRKMARAADGSLYAAHVEPAGPDETRVVVERVAPDGRVEALPPPRAAGGSTARPALALDANGTLHLAWTERAEDDREVFWATLRGGAWANATQLSTGPGYAGYPSLAADPWGRVHVAWYGFDGAFYQVYARAWDGASWSPAQPLSAGALDANNPSVVVDPAGTVHVAWFKEELRQTRVWHASKPADGAWTLPAAMPSEGLAFNAALAVDRAGRVHLAWDELRDDGYAVVHGSPPGAPLRVLARGPEGGRFPALAAWGDGILVAWSTPDGRLLASDLLGAPRPLLGGALGAHPSLRGPVLHDADATLDVLWTEPLGGDAHAVRRAAVPPGCSPFERPGACGGAGRDAPLLPGAAALALVLASMRKRAPF